MHVVKQSADLQSKFSWISVKNYYLNQNAETIQGHLRTHLHRYTRKRCDSRVQQYQDDWNQDLFFKSQLIDRTISWLERTRPCYHVRLWRLYKEQQCWNGSQWEPLFGLQVIIFSGFKYFRILVHLSHQTSHKKLFLNRQYEHILDRSAVHSTGFLGEFMKIEGF